MRSRQALLLSILLLQVGCCSIKSYEDQRHRAERAERELAQAQEFIAGAHQDNAMLQRYGIQLQEELMRWQYGSALQAKREADLRKSCNI